jgi:hypothetical protein
MKIGLYRRIYFTSEKAEMWQRGCSAKGSLGIYSDGGEVGAIFPFFIPPHTTP